MNSRIPTARIIGIAIGGDESNSRRRATNDSCGSNKELDCAGGLSPCTGILPLASAGGLAGVALSRAVGDGSVAAVSVRGLVFISIGYVAD
jgi:hypothetical protein